MSHSNFRKILFTAATIATIIMALPILCSLMQGTTHLAQSLNSEIAWILEATGKQEGTLHILPSGYKVREVGTNVEHTLNIGDQLDIWFGDQWIPGHLEWDSQIREIVFVADSGGVSIILTEGTRVRYR